jgi:undecaprenyl diphosphate synthase
MDGNGRWAAARGLTRSSGHKNGLAAVRMSIEECAKRGIPALTLFAFSSENWRRPVEEVATLMGLFMEALDKEITELHQNGVRIRFIGDRKALSVRLQQRIAAAEEQTSSNTRLQLQVAVSYGGRWDIVQAARKLAAQCAGGGLRADDITEERLAQAMELGVLGDSLCDPDLLIRTGGEQRISNFLLWNLAYAELYFTDKLWPEFDVTEFDAALKYFAARERRFGLTSAQKRSHG